MESGCRMKLWGVEARTRRIAEKIEEKISKK
jgi:hypothetical protein